MSDSLSDSLSLISAKLRAIAHLLESQRQVDLPVDYEDVLWGLGSILTDMSSNIREIGNQLGERELPPQKRAKRRLRKAMEQEQLVIPVDDTSKTPPVS